LNNEDNLFINKEKLEVNILNEVSMNLTKKLMTEYTLKLIFAVAKRAIKEEQKL
jgi:hypothetical protein